MPQADGTVCLPRMNAALIEPPTVPALLSGPRLRAALIAGCRRVLARRDHLNRINVFPVPDGDTGTNLAFTLNAVLGSARRGRGKDVGDLLARVARDAVDGARGNSGAIFAQFFQGLADALGRRSVADASTLANATEAAARSARGALAQPREGTILSVIGDFAAELRRQAERGVADLRAQFTQALHRARQSLADTPRQLPVLRAAGVVDAGAAGFVDFLEGVEEWLENGRRALRLPPGLRPVTTVNDTDVHLESVETDSRYRYCSECVVTGTGLDPTHIRAALDALPLDSLVVAGGRERIRVHAHIDSPNRLFEALAAFGEVAQRKADDMHAQARLRASAFQPVRVVCDSAADLPASEVERLGIGVIPVRVVAGEEDFLDRITLSADELYARLRQDPTPLRTSQPPAGDFRRSFELTRGHCDDVVALDVSSRVSGTWQAAVSAARDTDPDHIHVIDTLSASCGQALVTLSAAECAAAGGDVAQVRAAAAQAMENTRVYALIADLRYGVAGGRVPPLLKRLADLLRLRMLITIRDGRIKPFGALRARGPLMERFADRVLRRQGKDRRWRAIVAHCDAGDEAAALAGALRERMKGLDKIWVTECGPALGCHAGPGTVVVGLQRLPDSASDDPVQR